MCARRAAPRIQHDTARSPALSIAFHAIARENLNGPENKTPRLVTGAEAPTSLGIKPGVWF